MDCRKYTIIQKFNIFSTTIYGLIKYVGRLEKVYTVFNLEIRARKFRSSQSPLSVILFIFLFSRYYMIALYIVKLI